MREEKKGVRKVERRSRRSRGWGVVASGREKLVHQGKGERRREEGRSGGGWRGGGLRN